MTLATRILAFFIVVLTIGFVAYRRSPRRRVVLRGAAASPPHDEVAPPHDVFTPPHDVAPPVVARAAPPWASAHSPRARDLLRTAALTAGVSQQLPPPHAHRCAGNCSGHGACHALHTLTGWVPSCVCAPGWSGPQCGSPAPSPCNTPEGGRVTSRCAGHCDATTARCYCGGASRFPKRSMRSCMYDGVERDMPWQTPKWNQRIRGPKAAFWGGDRAWCDAPPRTAPRVRCDCYDGESGPLCEPIAGEHADVTFCLNQCSGRGACRSGFCECRAGAYGADCSLPTTPTTASTTAATPPRPRIYVYELPGEFNTFLLARRQNPDACVIREYQPAGGGATAPKWSNTLYGAEVAVHEALLASPHRTTDPAAADFFYVPVYGGCYISEFNRPRPDHWLCDECHKGKAADLASLRAMRWHEAALAHVRQSLPYWNRSGGADHLWPFTHDEGACYAPAALANATLLVHWGRLQPRPNGSSEYHLWRVRPHARRMYGWERCYDACKDLVLPSWRRPEDFASSPLRFAAAAAARAQPPPAAPGPKARLFYFNGALGRKGGGPGGARVFDANLGNYSFGLRQQLFALYGGREAEGVVVTDERSPSYGAALASSTFCGVLPGWGWSGRMEDAVLHGCIPVVLQDGVHTPWESVLEWEQYAVRVERRQMPRLLEILRAVGDGEVRARQAALQRVWSRFAYSGVIAAEGARRRGEAKKGAAVGGGAPDAVDTLLEVLHVRLLRREARAAGGGAAARPADGCRALQAGDEVSPPLAGEAPDYEGRTVSGWVI